MFRFTGSGRRAYADYVDTATDRMLEAEPGQTYVMRVTWDMLPVPPGDGFWEEAEGAPEAPEPAGTDTKTAPKGKVKNPPEVV